MDTWVRWAIGLVVVLHYAFAVAEIFFWVPGTTRLKIFSQEQAKANESVGRNMGVYNGILATLLIWPLLASTPVDAARSMATWLLAGVCVAGLFGTFTIKWTIVIFQVLPAVVALVLLWRGSGI